jgi:hypothetical protein
MSSKRNLVEISRELLSCSSCQNQLTPICFVAYCCTKDLICEFCYKNLSFNKNCHTCGNTIGLHEDTNNSLFAKKMKKILQQKTIVCQFCQENIDSDEILGHDSKCLSKEINCGYRIGKIKCEQKFKRSFQFLHKQECKIEKLVRDENNIKKMMDIIKFIKVFNIDGFSGIIKDSSCLEEHKQRGVFLKSYFDDITNVDVEKVKCVSELNKLFYYIHYINGDKIGFIVTINKSELPIIKLCESFNFSEDLVKSLFNNNGLSDDSVSKFLKL